MTRAVTQEQDVMLMSHFCRLCIPTEFSRSYSCVFSAVCSNLFYLMLFLFVYFYQLVPNMTNPLGPQMLLFQHRLYIAVSQWLKSRASGWCNYTLSIICKQFATDLAASAQLWPYVWETARCASPECDVRVGNSLSVTADALWRPRLSTTQTQL